MNAEATRILNYAQYGRAFLEALEMTQQTRTKCAAVRMALHQHREEHGC